jgi:hypothetical protein
MSQVRDTAFNASEHSNLRVLVCFHKYRMLLLLKNRPYEGEHNSNPFLPGIEISLTLQSGFGHICPPSRKEKAEDGGWFEKDDGWDPSRVITKSLSQLLSFYLIFMLLPVSYHS